MPDDKWIKYPDVEPIRRLQYEGRELLGKNIFIEPKRDGENVSIWLNDDLTPHISSRNLIDAAEDIVFRLKETEEFPKAVEALKDLKTRFNEDLIFFGELVNKGLGPTRIEPPHKKSHWYLFDVYDIEAKSFYTYTRMYQLAYHYRLPIIEAIDVFQPKTLDELEAKVEQWKSWAKRHRREGVVGKVYDAGRLIAFKEKIDLPKLPKLPKPQEAKIILPPMPEEKILRALQHAWDSLTANCQTEEEKIQLWKDKSKAMPVIALYINAEAREHHYSPPKNLYQIYLTTPIEKVKDKVTA